MEIMSRVQDGERLYNRGNLNEAIRKFKCALQTAEKAKESDVKLSNINVCRFNLAAVYAAKHKIENTNRYLGELNQVFLDRVENGRAYEKYLKVIAAEPWNKQALEEALIGQDLKRKRYILEILVKMDEISRNDKIRFFKTLETVYEQRYEQRDNLKRMQVMCQRAQLLYLQKEEEDSLIVLEEIEREYERHFGGHDEKIHTTTSKCNVLADQFGNTYQLEEIVPIWNEVGLLYSQLKKNDDAIDCFEKGLNLVGRRTSFDGFRATLYQNIGAAWILKSKSEAEYGEALKNTKKAIELNEQQDSDRAAKRQAKCFLNEGLIFFKLNERLRAYGAFMNASSASSGSGDERTNGQANEALGDLVMGMNEPQTAQNYLQIALEKAVTDEDKNRIICKLLNVRSRFARSSTGIQTAYTRNTLMTQRTPSVRMSSVRRNTQTTQTSPSNDYDSTSSGCDTSCSDDSSCSCCSSRSACCTDCESDSTYSSCYRKCEPRKQIRSKIKRIR